MKTVKITFKPVRTLSVPFGHFSMLQGLAYSLMAVDEQLALEIHDRNFTDRKAFKFFCFSDLEGRYSIRSKQLVFEDVISWEIRSVDDRIINAVEQSLMNGGIMEVYRQPCTILSYEVSEKHFFAEEMTVQMKTPIVVYNTLPSGYVRYYNPFEREFYDMLMRNIKNKWEMFFDEPFAERVSIECDCPSDDDKCVTHYKKSIINAWYGTYHIKAPSHLLEFIYYTGIGSKNSAGFGTFTEV